jgi:hypothetical protein
VISLPEPNGHLDAELRALEPVTALLRLASPALTPPPGLEGRVFLAVERAAREDERAIAPRRRVRVSLAFAGAAVAAAAALVLSTLGGPAGALELETVLRAPAGPAQASVEVRRTGIGRVISFESESLTILPRGQYYELWFVGAGDGPAHPNRISAGTFHPDERGRSHVRFAAAVDPAVYPVLAVTAEPGDGDPRATGPEVLRSAER